MDYIVLDLEWNQSPSGKEKENPDLPFEIIEIGAIRVDEGFRLKDSFSEKIRPQVYHQLHYRTKQLLKTSIKDYQKADKFQTVINRFLSWCKEGCGDDYMLVTWGPMDLDYLQNNMDFYRIKAPFKMPLFYYDAQKLFSIMFEDGKSRKSLQYAVEFLKIREDRPFHRAVDDAWYTAAVLTSMPKEPSLLWISVDYHNPPLKREEEIDLHFPDYSKFVSMTFQNKEDIMTDKVVLATPCQACQRSLRKKIRWFTSNNSTYYCLSVCKDHGYMQGKIRIKKADNGSYFAIRTTKMISEEKALSIREKQNQLRMKRKIRRTRIQNQSGSFSPAPGTVNISNTPAAADLRKRPKKRSGQKKQTEN